MIGFLAAGFTTAAGAQALEGVLMPGKVIAGHVKYEAECANCHVKFDKAAQVGLCLDCHKGVAGDVRTKRGFHGLQDLEPCRTCHTDHKGRNINIAQFDQKTFDHAKTNFSLVGAHPRVACKTCHVAGKKFRDAPYACNDCHRKDDKHKGSLGKLCADCHTQANWKEARFDHDKTKFALTLKHVDVACKECHRNNIFNNAPTTCVGCHRKDDNKLHRGRLGEKCESCHTAKNWKDTASFQHDRDTKYPLQGKHRTAKCETCHTVSPAREKTPTACIACHKKDDKQHLGRVGDKCESCHTPKNWKDTASFQHDRDTKYPLRGKHRTTKCEACHTAPPAREKTPTACIACHKKDDKHKESLGRDCAGCHSERDWKESQKFDHAKSSFPLLGKHARTECKECHKSPMFKEAPKECLACHKKDDKHNATLGEKCGECHTEKDWKTTEGRFSHDRTKFVLRNAHARTTVKCSACHKDLSSFRKTPLDCLACHKKDDKHEGQEGGRCEKCHDDRSWKVPQFDHGLTRFPLLGKHAPLDCAKCHQGWRYKDAKIACVACHAKDDKHKKTLGPDCGQCHNARTWKDLSFDHDTRTKFVLDGKHKAKACTLCHTTPTEDRATVSSLCFSCHARDDTHEGGFGRLCQQCHVTSSFKTLKRRTGLQGSGASPSSYIPPAGNSNRLSQLIPRTLLQ